MSTDDHPSPRPPEELALALRSHDLLAPFAERHLALITSAASRREIAAGELIFEEGGEGCDFYLIASGAVEARRETPVGTQRVAILGAGEVCGEISLLDGKPRSSTVAAVSAASLLHFDATRMASLVAEDPEIEVVFLRIFCRSLARKIRQANQVMTQIMAPDATTSRVAAGTRGTRDAVDEETKRRILREQGMGSPELQQLCTFLEGERFSAGETIFAEGELGDTLYIVADGRVRISRHIPGMGEEALAILDRGEVFGEMAWIDSSPRSADALAHTGGCSVLAIGRNHLDGTLGQSLATHSQFLKLICQVLCRRIRNMNDQLVAYRTMAFF